jgi:cytochrome c-type biogenesis protein
MIMPDVSIYTAFVAGLISFLSPCILPIVPGYISFLSGMSVEEIEGSGEKRLLLVNSIFFITGFSVVFILLGASATMMGAFLTSKMSILTKIAGLVIILFGIFKLGLIRHLAFYREARFQLKDRRFGVFGAMLIGAAFAFGWTPCIGPILGSILAYAATLGKVSQGISLLVIYSMGLGVPFLIVTFALNRFFRIFDRIKKHLRLIEIVSGIIMIILGLMIMSNKLILIPGYLYFLNKFAL